MIGSLEMCGRNAEFYCRNLQKVMEFVQCCRAGQTKGTRTVVMEASRSCKVSILGVVTLEDIAGIFPLICTMYLYLKTFCYQNN